MKNQSNKILFGHCVKTNLAEFDPRHRQFLRGCSEVVHHICVL